MRAFLSRMLILILLFVLVGIPPVAAGHAASQQGDAARARNEFSQAAQAYEKAAYLLPWSPGLWEQAGQMWFSAGDPVHARSLLERARTLNSLSPSGWDLLGIVYLSEDGNLQAALEIWKAGLTEYPDYGRFFYRLSLAYYELDDLSAERAALEAWVLMEGELDASAHYRLGLLSVTSDPDRALEEFLLASSLDPEYDPAVDTMRTTLDLASLEEDQSRRMIVIGRGLGLVGEWRLAREAFRKAVGDDLAYGEAWAWLGEAEQQIGRDGISELDKALSLDPRNPIIRSLRGLYWTRQDRADKALEEYKLAAEYDPINPAWQVSIGEAYSQSGDLQAALESYLRAIEIAPSDGTYWRLLAEFCARYDMQIEEYGLPAAEMAVELTGEDPLALDALGWTLTLLERTNEAQDVLEHALSLNPELERAHLHLGILALQQGEWETARVYLQQARDLDKAGPVGAQAGRLLNQYFP